MGDRGNAFIVTEHGENRRGVFLYTHWGGTDLPLVVAEALDSPAGRNRVDDPAYLARIVFCEMVRGEEREETGYGICTYAPDNEHPVIVIDGRAARVWFSDVNKVTDVPPEDALTFDAFIDLHKAPERVA